MLFRDQTWETTTHSKLLKKFNNYIGLFGIVHVSVVSLGSISGESSLNSRFERQRLSSSGDVRTLSWHACIDEKITTFTFTICNEGQLEGTLKETTYFI
jgi:hypothetical protein